MDFKRVLDILGSELETRLEFMNDRSGIISESTKKEVHETIDEIRRAMEILTREY